MRRHGTSFWIILAAIAIAAVSLSAQPDRTATEGISTAPASMQVTAYTLPPDLSLKAHNLGRIRFWLALLEPPYGVVILWALLSLQLAPRYRDWSEEFFRAPFLQSAFFAALFLVTLELLNLPFHIYGEMISKQYGLSIQSWSSWAWDWIKAELVSIVIGIGAIWLLYAVIRRSPRRWWFYFWLVSLPCGLALVFLQPWVFDPLFHKFEPLQQKDPALTAALELLVQRAGENIPPERMFWMSASQKTTGLNAYVAGIGASKRIVVWDTTVAKMNTPQIVYVAGHEMGHYVLLHIPKGLAIGAVLMLALFYVGYRVSGWMLRRWGERWGIRGVDDLASLPVFLLVLTILIFLPSPLFSSISRYFEHQADQYGLEVTHGLTPDSSQIAAQSFQILGEVDLSDPDPNPVDVFMYYDHPSIADRIRFCLDYDPWANGGHGEFVK